MLFRSVTLGELTANGVMVVNGLSQNDIVIIEGMQKVSEGMNVRVL